MERCQICAVALQLYHGTTTVVEQWSDRPSPPLAYLASSKIISPCGNNPTTSGCKDICYTVPNRLRESWRHFPGPGCVLTRAYSGHRITLQEMRGCEDVLYIVEKPDGELSSTANTIPENDSDYFIPSVNYGIVEEVEGIVFKIVPNRKRLIVPANWPDPNWNQNQPTRASLGIPVHVWCWNIFEKVCRTNLGKVDLQGFAALWNRNSCLGCGFQQMPHHFAIRTQRPHHAWIHVPGTEFLASDPVRIAELQFLLSAAAIEPSRELTASAILHSDSGDPFALLPLELRLSIIEQLSISELLNLRKCSRSFQSLKPLVWCALVKRDFPWIWELEMQVLSSPEVNWAEIYKAMYLSQQRLLGLKNRRRIWNVSQEIVTRIQQLRERLPEELDSEGNLRLPAALTDEELNSRLSRGDVDCLSCKQLH